MDLNQDYLQAFDGRLKKFGAVVLAVIVLIIGRVYYLQGIRGAFYRMFSDENSIHEVPVPAPRGVLWDRGDLPLVDNRPVFDLVLIPQYVVEPEKVFETLRRRLNIPDKAIRTVWEKRRSQPAYRPLVISRDIAAEAVSWVKVRKSPWGKINDAWDLRGVEVRLRFEREYPDGGAASHLLGYLREADRERLEALQKEHPGLYKRGDWVGVRGLEEVWDAQLRGEEGFTQKVVNAVGREINIKGMEKELTRKSARPGRHLQLTIDARLQKRGMELFEGKRGAVVALDPRDGAVLALLSAPSPDMNRVSRDTRESYWKTLLRHPDRTLLNRAIQSAYPPGSIYKIVAGLAALQEGVTHPHETVYCDGGYTFGNRRFRCWKTEGHGAVDFMRALIVSCDVYFYTMGHRLGVDRLARYAKAFGLGEPTGIPLPGEKGGLVPTRGWKENRYRTPWMEGETLSVAIGQGYNNVTPLQAALMAAVVANGGRRVTPHLVAATIDPESGEREGVAPPAQKENEFVFSRESLERVRKALVGVVMNAEGTAHGLSLLKIPMGGKTGTAQTVSRGTACSGRKCGDHSWFVAFAPPDEPRIAVAVLVEHGGHGSSVAAPIAGELVRTFLNSDEERVAGKF